MTFKPTPLPFAQLQQVLATGRRARPHRDHDLERIIQARRAAESAIGLAMVTSAIPGIEVRYLDAEDASSNGTA